jgi:hypothetical protein
MVTSSGQNPSIRSPHSRNDQSSRFPLPRHWRALAQSAPLRMKKLSRVSSSISAGNPNSCSPCAFDRNGLALCQPYNRYRGATHPTITLVFSPLSLLPGPGLPADALRSRVADTLGPAVVLTLGWLRVSQAIRFPRANARAAGSVIPAPRMMLGNWARPVATGGDLLALAQRPGSGQVRLRARRPGPPRRDCR